MLMSPFLNDYIYKYIYARFPILHTFCTPPWSGESMPGLLLFGPSLAPTTGSPGPGRRGQLRIVRFFCRGGEVVLPLHPVTAAV